MTDLFELQRGLNNAFAYDLVPSTEVVEAALRASRKVNDFATAVRILEGVKEKVENKGQYDAYIQELQPVIDELGESRVVRRSDGARVWEVRWDIRLGSSATNPYIFCLPQTGLEPAVMLVALE